VITCRPYVDSHEEKEKEEEEREEEDKEEEVGGAIYSFSPLYPFIS